jgi:hypothetical protein
MSSPLSTWAHNVQRLCDALGQLRPLAAEFGTPGPEGEEWHELLERKLRPQLSGEPVLVAAVVGGTNIGKSVIFNHLVGENASGVSPLAAGTKHPVCLVPPPWAQAVRLAPLFEGFELVAWQSPENPLEDTPEHLLFWRAGHSIPERLLVLDTPDIDSDAPVNWHRADQVRQTADVLIGVLTQQKYNDAAVKQFFRKAAEADKPIVVVFNQVDLEEDRQAWPQWLNTFVEETGAATDLVYVVPYDRKAAGSLELPFYAVGGDGLSPPIEARSLRDDLAALHFEAIKTRTLRGALARVTDSDRGAASYLARIRIASREYAAAAEALSAAEMARVQWPALPPRLLVEEIRTWWDNHRQPWSRTVHGVYRTIGRGVTWPVRAAWEAVSGPAVQPEVSFAEREREAILLAVSKLLDELDRLARVGNDTLRPRLAELLKGDARRDLIQRVELSHAQLPAVDDDYRRFVREELDRWSVANPRAIGFLRSLDHVLAVARPAITVSLTVSGFVLAGGLVQEAATHAITHTAGELAIAGGIAGGSVALDNTTGEGLSYAAAQLFRRLQTRYAESRAAWLAAWLERELMGDLLTELRRGAELPQSEAFRAADAALSALARPVKAAALRSA